MEQAWVAGLSALKKKKIHPPLVKICLLAWKGTIINLLSLKLIFFFFFYSMSGNEGFFFGFFTLFYSFLFPHPPLILPLFILTLTLLSLRGSQHWTTKLSAGPNWQHENVIGKFWFFIEKIDMFAFLYIWACREFGNWFFIQTLTLQIKIRVRFFFFFQCWVQWTYFLMGHIFCISPISIIHKPIFLNCSSDIGFSFNWLKFKIEMNSFSSGKSLYLITNSEGPMIFFLFLSCGVCFLYLKKFKH